MDCHLYRSLSNYLREEKLKMNHLSFFGEKFQDVYERGILYLSECWQQVTDRHEV